MNVKLPHAAITGLVLAFIFSFPGRAYACPGGAYCGEYLVKFSDRASKEEIQAVLEKHSLSEANFFKTGKIHHITGDADRDPRTQINALNAEPEVSYAEPNYEVWAQPLPNDPMFGDQWAFQNTGQYSGIVGDDLGMDSVWEQITGSPSMVVAVLDSGIDYDHEDLAANMWQNPGEIPGNGVDDEGNGYVDDVYGYNFLSDTGDPADDYFHGTHVAGIIGAVGNNGIGVTGVAWEVRLMALKFMGATGRGPLSAAIQAIDYAVANGAKVINNSWTFTYPGLSNLPATAATEPVQSLRAVIADADRAGVIFVVAAGNSANNNDSIPFYPASYSLRNVISVAATDSSDLIANFSNYGRTTVDLGAPGIAILSTYPTWKISPPYKTMGGTSQASPEVAGGAALLWMEHPEMTHRQIIDLILQGAKPAASLQGKTKTGGRLDLERSFTLAGSGTPGMNHPPVANAGADQSVLPGATVTLRGSATDADGDSPLSYAWSLNAPAGSASQLSSASDATVSLDVDAPGIYLASLVAGDGQSFSVPSTVRVVVASSSSINHAPAANAGPSQARVIGDAVRLFGRASDVDGNPLTYRWFLAPPAGSSAVLRRPAALQPTFGADVAGIYAATLTVNDGFVDARSSVEIYVTSQRAGTNRNPIANPGPNQVRTLGDTVLLIGGGSDPEGDVLNFQWSLTRPIGSQAALMDAAHPTASFHADTPGRYIATLVVDDGTLSSSAASVSVYVDLTADINLSEEEPAPEAESIEEFSGLAGPPTVVIEAFDSTALQALDPTAGNTVQPGEAITLDGTQSQGAGVEDLDYRWNFVEKPAGSMATIQKVEQALTAFTPDREGRYTVQLTVHAGKYSTQGEKALMVNKNEQKEEGNLSGSAGGGGCSLNRAGVF